MGVSVGSCSMGESPADRPTEYLVLAFPGPLRREFQIARGPGRIFPLAADPLAFPLAIRSRFRGVLACRSAGWDHPGV
jgi:hypothetical protein